ncbi:methyltransferase domain-containing protein [Actinomadura rudentiformis]|uniref:Methyltransferase domain-containing protein n=1 Tax=Actinomadura rudentiformis TaxID=359158 RepID=A0A6H9YJY0_9ACTN|nr:methyltransferase domain-containing protein [Actinomadura rudentiformis]KAB2344713.1 methyltransferase domain-containing protein [Actinomadura rudentiformis]
MSTTDDIKALIPLLDAVDAAPGAAQLRARSYELLAPAPGALVVDVGCGAGRAVTELAGQGVRAVGVDISEEMIAAARHRWPDRDFRLGSAFELPFHDGEVSGYRADKVFHALDDSARAISEAQRVLAPGGRIVLIGQDWDTFVIDSDDPHLTRTIVHARADLVANPRIARSCRNLLLDAGFEDVAIEVHTGVLTGPTAAAVVSGMAEAVSSAGVISQAQADAWVADQRERADMDRAFLAVPFFVASATR